ncbi:MAG: CDP-diacylglycerol--glycerol-3-phosphate 3-phosphatidyltransferase [Verrucomicrobiota bacterium]|jgi:CDP-diacylglycerol--glycerol-3-phosphate 3-phosphatidyltransferase
MNLPNQLTVSRFALTGLFWVAAFAPFPGNRSWALVLFSLASLTDFLDGKIARERKLITAFGTLMDPLADKILTCSAFIAFIELRQIEAWMVAVIVGRELAITGLRLLAASKNVVLAAERLGKHKTVSQITTILATLLAMSYPQWGFVGEVLFAWPVLGRPWIVTFAQATQWVAVALTLYSGATYLWRNRHLYLHDM